ncbi:MAG: chromosome segregation protein SMC [Candidatus Tritonobacter lacicola]|nr:chromosome segregation protein SMC [Candidatus Tritonobacter lacicola]
MRFKRLEMIGFKSFLERTVLDFEPGVTAIVGPNGCGKSNISDAIRWVLGEQRARSLRGTKMEDVIFNGTTEREPIGMAEVSLTMSNADGVLPIDYTEVTVTRQLFRSGESRYLLNRNPCRLKDINELFMNTGLGASEYSIIEQGKMDVILSSRPEERRALFEEAAGITKYKARKKEAQRKLESTEGNLTRLEDIIKEVRRQINSIKRQVSKAQKYKELYAELTEAETAVSLVDYKRHIDEIEQFQSESDRIRGEVEAGEAELRRLDENMSALRERTAGYEQRIDEFQAERIELRGRSDAARTRLESNRGWIEEISRNTDRGADELEEIDRRVKELDERRVVVEEELNTIAGKCDVLQEKVEESEGALKALDEAISGARGRIEKARGEALEVQNRLTRLSNGLAAIRARQREVALAKRRATVELEDAKSRKKSLELKLSDEKAALEKVRERLGSLAREGERIDSERARCEAFLEDSRKETLVLEKSHSRVSSKVELVREIGAPAPLEEVLGGDGWPASGMVGFFSELIEIEDGYADAVYAALADRYADLVSDGFKSSSDIALALDRKGVKQIAVSHVDDWITAEDRMPGPEVPEGARPAMEVVTADERLRGLTARLLGNVVIVEDIESAIDLWPECKGSFDVVTRSGHLISAGGRIVLGGAGRGRGWLSGKLDVLEGEASLLGEKLALAKRRRGEAESAAAALAEKRETHLSELRRVELELYSGERDMARSETEAVHSRDEELALSSQFGDLEEEAGRLGESEAKSEAATAACRREEGELEKIIAESQMVVDEKGVKKEEIASRVGDVRLELATLTGRRSNIEMSHREIITALEDRKNALAARIGDVDTTKARVEKLLSENGDLARELEELESRKINLDSEAAELSSERSRLRSLVKADDEKQRAQRGKLDELWERQKDLDVRIAGLKPEAEGILQRIREEYGIDLAERLDEAAVAAEGLEEKRGCILEIKEKIRRMGPVNLGAIEEHDELSERFSFLEEQKNDLAEAKDALNRAIIRINQTTKKMFSETFEAIRANFKEIYQQLFGGGKADLVLLDESDILESGIEIVARPPGKKLQGVSLLSGGERAMTGVALLFALFKVKPSPFCVLDEIDAPLDEANINRFVDLLAGFVSSSQFIIITHNKRTIGMADILYGITMEESGVSRVVSVKFTKEKDAEKVGLGASE